MSLDIIYTLLIYSAKYKRWKKKRKSESYSYFFHLFPLQKKNSLIFPNVKSAKICQKPSLKKNNEC